MIRSLILVNALTLSLSCAQKPNKTEPTPVVETASAPVDPLLAELNQMVENCRFKVQHAVVSHCKNNEKRELIRAFRRGKRSHVQALPILVDALESDSEKLTTAASKLLSGGFRGSFGDASKGDVKPVLAKRLLSALKILNKRQASQILPATVHAAVLSGETEALYAALSALPSVELRATAYTHLMRHGGLEVIPKIQELVSGQDERVVAAALESARSFPSQDEATRKAVCELGLSVVSDPRLSVAAKSSRILAVCGGAYADQLLEEIGKRADNDRATAGQVRALDTLCMDRAGQRHGSDAQCQRARKLLEMILTDAKQSPEARAFSVLGLGYQFPDARTLRLATKYTNADHKRLRTHAKQTVERLTQQKRGKKSGKAPKPQAERRSGAPTSPKR